MTDNDALKEEYRLWMGRQMANWKRDVEADMRGMQNVNWMEDGPPRVPPGAVVPVTEKELKDRATMLAIGRSLRDGSRRVPGPSARVESWELEPDVPPRRSWWSRLKGMFEPEGMK